jgi:hypothetical protein
VSGAVRPASGPPGSWPGEITHVFPSQWAAAQEILERAGRARSVDLLALRGSEIVGLNDPLREAAAAAPDGDGVRVRVLLLDPDSDAARQRAAGLGEDADSFLAAIRSAQAQLGELAGRSARLSLTVYYYASVPAWRMVVIDGEQYISTLCAGEADTEAVVYKLALTPHGALYQGFQQVFEDLVAGARRVA